MSVCVCARAENTYRRWKWFGLNDDEIDHCRKIQRRQNDHNIRQPKIPWLSQTSLGSWHWNFQVFERISSSCSRENSYIRILSIADEHSNSQIRPQSRWNVESRLELRTLHCTEWTSSLIEIVGKPPSSGRMFASTTATTPHSVWRFYLRLRIVSRESEMRVYCCWTARRWFVVRRFVVLLVSSSVRFPRQRGGTHGAHNKNVNRQEAEVK